MHPLLFSIPAPARPIAVSPALALLGALFALWALWFLVQGARRLAAETLLWAALFGGAAWALRAHGLRLGAIEVDAFAACLAFGLGLGFWLTRHLAERASLPLAHAGNLSWVSAFGALLGARSFYLVASPERESLTQAVSLAQGGLFGYGALFGAALAAGLWLRHKRLALLPWFDVGAVGALSIASVTRVGCYLEGCDFGKRLAAGVPEWFSRFGEFPGGLESRSLAFLRQVESGSVASAASWSLPLHPVELYEAFGSFVLLAFALWSRARQRQAGQLFWRIVLSYGALRFVLEFWRGDVDRGVWGPVSLTQLCALASASCAAWVLLRTASSRSSVSSGQRLPSSN